MAYASPAAATVSRMNAPSTPSAPPSAPRPSEAPLSSGMMEGVRRRRRPSLYGGGREGAAPEMGGGAFTSGPGSELDSLRRGLSSPAGARPADEMPIRGRAAMRDAYGPEGDSRRGAPGFWDRMKRFAPGAAGGRGMGLRSRAASMLGGEGGGMGGIEEGGGGGMGMASAALGGGVGRSGGGIKSKLMRLLMGG